MLRAISQHTGSTMRDLAARVSETGELPDLPSLDAGPGQRIQTSR